MNDAQPAPGASLLPDSTGLITSIHFVLIALFALAAIAIILIGIVRKRRRRHAEHAVEERIEQAEEAAAGADAPPETTAAREGVADAVVPNPAIAPAAHPAAIPIATGHAAATPRPEPTLTLVPPPAEPIVPPPAGAAEPLSVPQGDDPAAMPLTQLKGLGPKVATQLAGRGIHSVGDLAALSDDEARALDADLGAFAGRLSRDRWLEQARLLASGDRSGFEAVFGKL